MGLPHWRKFSRLMLEDLSTTKKVAGISGISMAALLAVLLPIGDDRYAMSSDLQDVVSVVKILATNVQLDRESRAEYRVRDVERRMKHIMVIPVADRTTYQQSLLVDLQFEKKEALRQREDTHK